MIMIIMMILMISEDLDFDDSEEIRKIWQLRDEAEEMAASLGLILHTTSAKVQIIEDVFVIIIDNIIKNIINNILTMTMMFQENLNIEPVFRNLAQALTPARQPRWNHHHQNCHNRH